MSMQSNKMMTAKSILSTLGSVAAATMVARSVVNDFLPYEIRDYLYSTLHSIFSRRLSSEITMIIEEFEGLESNDIFEAAELYIGSHTKATSSSTAATRIKVRKPDSSKQIQVNVDRNEEVEDEFEGVKFKWMLHCYHVQKQNYYNPRDMNSTLRAEVRTFHLTFHKKHKEFAIHKYLPHILKKAESLKQETKTVQLFTVDPNNLYSSPADVWTSINLNHPSTFETLAMDTELKQTIMEDLRRFVRRKEYYQRVGKAWKRGYLLYGPPGTGKSSLIAAMANYLNFDIYDLEISGLSCDTQLRKALVGTASKSIIVVEDIDCSIEFDRNNNNNNKGGDTCTGGGHIQPIQQEKVTLSGLLNFIDGLWSTCGDERIIIFTTNHKEKLDPALLRPGRMDLHIQMSYCTPSAFNILANNYLGLKHHQLFLIIQRLISEVEVTPAEVAEQLMRHDHPDLALNHLFQFLELKKVKDAKAELENEESKLKELKDEDKDMDNIEHDKVEIKSIENLHANI